MMIYLPEGVYAFGYFYVMESCSCHIKNLPFSENGFYYSIFRKVVLS